tara:strand:+ start:141 stop:377 length:237 start_codon:yes stop_codon:yes gene_type:complete
VFNPNIGSAQITSSNNSRIPWILSDVMASGPSLSAIFSIPFRNLVISGSGRLFSSGKVSYTLSKRSLAVILSISLSLI